MATVHLQRVAVRKKRSLTVLIYEFYLKSANQTSNITVSKTKLTAKQKTIKLFAYNIQKNNIEFIKVIHKNLHFDY